MLLSIHISNFSFKSSFTYTPTILYSSPLTSSSSISDPLSPPSPPSQSQSSSFTFITILPIAFFILSFRQLYLPNIGTLYILSATSLSHSPTLSPPPRSPTKSSHPSPLIPSKTPIFIPNSRHIPECNFAATSVPAPSLPSHTSLLLLLPSSSLPPLCSPAPLPSLISPHLLYLLTYALLPPSPAPVLFLSPLFLPAQSFRYLLFLIPESPLPFY